MCTLENQQQMSAEMKKLAHTNAVKYQRYKDQLPNIDSAEISEFRYEIERAFERIQRSSVNPNNTNFIQFVDHDPYETLIQMSNDIELHDKMLISTLNNNSALLPGDLNLKFRAVHDFLHYFLQQPFGFVGEYKVYQAQKHIHKSKLRRQILYSEVVLQAAYCEYYGKFADEQKIVL